MREIFAKAQRFIYRNARPLDLARWKFHFEDGSKEEVIKILGAYQNEDGGFGHALEADSWNPKSTPIATWTATVILNEIGVEEAMHPVMQGILRYLDNGSDFGDGRWFRTVPSNNDYPHAIWWHCEGEDGELAENPTVSLAGFALKYADRKSRLRQKASEIAKREVEAFMENPTEEFHTLRCYMQLLHYCEDMEDFELFDLAAFREKVYEMIEKVVCREPEKWFTEYVCKPSHFFDRTCCVFEVVGTELCRREAELVVDRQQEDGSYPVTWQWWTEYKEFEISQNWWRSAMVIENMLYLKACLNR